MAGPSFTVVCTIGGPQFIMAKAGKAPVPDICRINLTPNQNSGPIHYVSGIKINGLGRFGMEIENKLAEMGLERPTPTVPPAHRSSAVRTGNLVFVGGHVPRMPDGGMLHPGKLGQDVTVEQGYEAAQRVMLNCLGSLKGEIGDLDKVTRVVKLLCMVNSAPGFGDQPRVANGATDLLGNLYGDRGRHARSAVGLEKGTGQNSTCIEIEMIVEIQD